MENLNFNSLPDNSESFSVTIMKTEINENPGNLYNVYIFHADWDIIENEVALRRNKFEILPHAYNRLTLPLKYKLAGISHLILSIPVEYNLWYFFFLSIFWPGLGEALLVPVSNVKLPLARSSKISLTVCHII